MSATNDWCRFRRGSISGVRSKAARWESARPETEKGPAYDAATMKTGIQGIFGDEHRPGATGSKLAQAAHVAALQGHRQALLESPRYSDEKRLLKFGYRVYSQSDEDGILQEIFRRIGTKSRSFIEIGSGDGLENNTLYLLMQGWHGIWIEASARKVATARSSAGGFIRGGALRIERQFVRAANVDGLLARLASEAEVDLVSLDIDGNDFYVLQALQSISPRVVVCEYNAKFPPDVAWVMEHNESHRWNGTDYFGASLKAWEMLLERKGYSLVGCNLLGCNAFFVRKDLAADPPFCSPFSAANHYEPARYFLLPAYQAGFPAGFGPFRLVD